MESTVKIRYGSSLSSPDNYFDFSGMPTPYLSRNQEMVYYGGKWCQLTAITLDGQIIGSEPVSGESLNTLSIKKDREKILSGFSESFNKLAIYENNTAYKIFDGCIIKDISFSPANYGVQDYSINIECLENDEFQGTFGVMEPQESVNFTDNRDGTLGISHTVSAQGFTTNSSAGSNVAIVNAKNFVESRTGYDINKVIPQFTSGISNNNLVINDINREINRVDGTYSCTINYMVQTGVIPAGTGSGENLAIQAGIVNMVDTSISSGAQDDFLTVTVNYSVKGDKYATPTSVRNNKPTTGTLHSFASGAVKGTTICSLPLSLDVDDNADTNKSIAVTATYDNNTIYESLNTGVYFDYNVDVSTDDVTDVATVSINGEIKARGNNRAQFALKSGYYHDVIKNSLFSLANSTYSGVNLNVLYGNAAWALNPIATNSDVTMNPIAGTVNCSASFDNKDFKSNYKNFTYKVDVTPSLRQYSAKPSCNQNGLYKVFDLNTKTREKINLNVSSKADKDTYANGNFNFLKSMHDYANTLRVAMIPASASDIVIESESPSAPEVYSPNSALQQNFDSSISQGYTYEVNSSFYS